MGFSRSLRAAPTQAMSSHTRTNVEEGVQQHCEPALLLASVRN